MRRRRAPTVVGTLGRNATEDRRARHRRVNRGTLRAVDSRRTTALQGCMFVNPRVSCGPPPLLRRWHNRFRTS
eukprot:11775098-Alexandrium_andersonii.AAC.1